MIRNPIEFGIENEGETIDCNFDTSWNELVRPIDRPLAEIN